MKKARLLTFLCATVITSQSLCMEQLTTQESTLSTNLNNIRFHVPTWNWNTPTCNAPNHHIFFKVLDVKCASTMEEESCSGDDPDMGYENKKNTALLQYDPSNKIYNLDRTKIVGDKIYHMSQHLRIVKLKDDRDYIGRSICTKAFLSDINKLYGSSPVVFTLQRASGMENGRYFQNTKHDAFKHYKKEDALLVYFSNDITSD